VNPKNKFSNATNSSSSQELIRMLHYRILQPSEIRLMTTNLKGLQHCKPQISKALIYMIGIVIRKPELVQWQNYSSPLKQLHSQWFL